jgi:transposase
LDVREILRRFQAGETDRAIARALGVARRTVSRYRRLAGAAGYGDGTLPAPEELERWLKERMPESPFTSQAYKAAPYREVIEKLRRAGVERQAILERLREDHGYTGSYASIWRYVEHLEGGRPPEAFCRIETLPGEEAQVDFGYAGHLIDPRTGKERRAWVFVMTLSYSRHQYARFVFDQKLATWLRLHEEAFQSFGGVPRKVVIDNTKTAIVKAALYDPIVQRTYREFAEHYGFLISPCRPRTPEHKGKVESGVGYVKRNFLAGRPPMPIVQGNEKLLVWVEETAGMRIHGTTKERPLARFLEIERAALLPLPCASYDHGIWKQAKLHPDCHVVIDGAYYSAPHRLIGRKLWVRTNGREVVIFHDYERVATHPWGPPGSRQTNPAHYPPEKVAYLLATPASCQKRARTIGEATAELVDRLFAERPLDRLRAVQAILRLARKYGPKRLEAAARRALLFGETSYGTVKRILEKGLENDPLPEALALPPTEKRTYAFARPGSEIFPARRSSWT